MTELGASWILDFVEPKDKARKSSEYKDRKIVMHTVKGGKGKVARIRKK